jgi:hypothetical protein
MDIPALASYVPVALSQNRLLENIPAVDVIDFPERTNLRYLMDVYVQEHFRASDYLLVTTPSAQASEYPPEPIGQAMRYPGAHIEIQDILDSFLSRTAPNFNQTEITLCPDMVRAYYTDKFTFDGDAPIDQDESVVSYVLKAGISETQFKDWGNLLLTDKLGKAGKFLTWQPDNKFIAPDQPEYLYFLNNLNPSPNEIRLRAELFFEDGGSEFITVRTLSTVTPMSVYCVPVGVATIPQLAAHSWVVTNYRVWLSNENGLRISDTRMFYIDSTYRPYNRYILFNNSLGGFDTLRCSGSAAVRGSYSKTASQRYPALDSDPSYSEVIVSKVVGEKGLSLATGYLNKEQRLYLEELYFAKEILSVETAGHRAMFLSGSDYVQHDDSEDIPARSFTLLYANPVTNASFLPPAPPKVIRQTAWRGDRLGCELDESTGLRSGFKRYELLVNYYVDTNEDVTPILIKPNTPGTEGYIEKWPSVDCAASSTPFLSAPISIISSKKRLNCTGVLAGTKWTIIVPAGAYGSNKSQQDADARAQAAWNSMDTQVNANLFGACVNPLPIVIKLTTTADAVANLYLTEQMTLGSYTDGQIISNTGIGSTQSTTLAPGTHKLTAHQDANSENYRFRIPSRGITSPTFSGGVNWVFVLVIEPGDTEIVIFCENA